MSRSATVHDLAPSKLPPPPTLQTILQLGVGGGVKAGCNVWRALRNIEGDRAMHTTWRHLGGKGITGEHPLSSAHSRLRRSQGHGSMHRRTRRSVTDPAKCDEDA